MTDRELMQMVIDAWRKLDLADLSKAVTALRDRLAQPERVDEKAKDRHEWVGLTDEEVGGLTVFSNGLHHVEVPILADLIRAIEAKLKEKNA